MTTAEGVTSKFVGSFQIDRNCLPILIYLCRGFFAVVRNNLLGTWNMTHAVATLAMIPQNRGSLVNVIAQIKRGFPGMVHTGAARAGVDVRGIPVGFLRASNCCFCRT